MHRQISPGQRIIDNGHGAPVMRDLGVRRWHDSVARAKQLSDKPIVGEPHIAGRLCQVNRTSFADVMISALGTGR
jgi:hypothetical protein